MSPWLMTVIAYCSFTSVAAIAVWQPVVRFPLQLELMAGTDRSTPASAGRPASFQKAEARAYSTPAGVGVGVGNEGGVRKLGAKRLLSAKATMTIKTSAPTIGIHG